MQGQQSNHLSSQDNSSHGDIGQYYSDPTYNQYSSSVPAGKPHTESYRTQNILAASSTNFKYIAGDVYVDDEVEDEEIEDKVMYVQK